MRLKLLVLLIVSLLLPSMLLAEILTVSFSGTELRSAPNAMASKVITKITRYSPLSVIEKGPEGFSRTEWMGASFPAEQQRSGGSNHRRQG
jgi:hypothetical protein